MRSAWHVYNLKRRVGELPPVSARAYDTIVVPVTTKAPASREASSKDSTGARTAQGSSESDQLPGNTECLFCCSKTTSEDDNLQHMKTCHGFLIPDIDQLETDLETLLNYLALVICRYHSCIHCGHEKHSAEAARSHMLSKGHCMLDLSSESEYLEFWKPVEKVYGECQTLLDCELRSQSGTIVQACSTKKAAKHIRSMEKCRTDLDKSSQRDSSEQTRSGKSQDLSVIAASSSKQSRSLAQCDEMGIVGLSDVQQRALMVAERKDIAQNFRTRNKAQWTRDRLGNKTKQKYFKACTISRSSLFIDPCRR